MESQLLSPSQYNAKCPLSQKSLEHIAKKDKLVSTSCGHMFSIKYIKNYIESCELGEAICPSCEIPINNTLTKVKIASNKVSRDHFQSSSSSGHSDSLDLQGRSLSLENSDKTQDCENVFERACKKSKTDIDASKDTSALGAAISSSLVGSDVESSSSVEPSNFYVYAVKFQANIDKIIATANERTLKFRMVSETHAKANLASTNLDHQNVRDKTYSTSYVKASKENNVALNLLMKNLVNFIASFSPSSNTSDASFFKNACVMTYNNGYDIMQLNNQMAARYCTFLLSMISSLDSLPSSSHQGTALSLDNFLSEIAKKSIPDIDLSEEERDLQEALRISLGASDTPQSSDSSCSSNNSSSSKPTCTNREDVNLQANIDTIVDNIRERVKQFKSTSKSYNEAHNKANSSSIASVDSWTSAESASDELDYQNARNKVYFDAYMKASKESSQALSQLMKDLVCFAIGFCDSLNNSYSVSYKNALLRAYNNAFDEIMKLKNDMVETYGSYLLTRALSSNSFSESFLNANQFSGSFLNTDTFEELADYDEDMLFPGLETAINSSLSSSSSSSSSSSPASSSKNASLSTKDIDLQTSSNKHPLAYREAIERFNTRLLEIRLVFMPTSLRSTLSSSEYLDKFYPGCYQAHRLNECLKYLLNTAEHFNVILEKLKTGEYTYIPEDQPSLNFFTSSSKDGPVIINDRGFKSAKTQLTTQLNYMKTKCQQFSKSVSSNGSNEHLNQCETDFEEAIDNLLKELS